MSMEIYAHKSLFALLETLILCRRLAEQMASLRHSSGAPAFVLYSSWTQNSNNVRGQYRQDSLPGVVGWGPTVTFNVLRADGNYVGFR